MGKNANMRRLSALSLVSCVLLTHDRPAIAQSNSGFEHARISLTSVQHYVAADSAPRQLSVPPNLVVPSMYQPVVESMLRGSPTFRRQCMRIDGEPLLTVVFTINSAPPRTDVRATTRVTRHADGRVTAAVYIGSFGNTEELIAHELEHIIEQLDGVDLAARAALPHTGVTAVGYSPNMFETIRAKRVGLKVVSELRR